VYGAGGAQVTVTDANVLLGRLDGDHFLGGAMALHPPLAHAAIADGLAAALGIGVREAALGVVRVANANIDRALRRVSVARGHDPRDFTLVAFGGAGPLHACEVAAGLGIPRVLVPRYPGVLCALGLLMADVVLEHSRAVLEVVCPTLEQALHAHVDQMRALASSDLAQEGFVPEDMRFVPLVDARYRGQSHELTIPFAGEVSEAFHRAHARAYGHAMRERAVEIVNVRLQATGLTAKPRLVAEPVVPQDVGPGHEAHLGPGRVVCLAGERTVDRYLRAQLPPGARFTGPALVFQMDSTVYLPPYWSAAVDAYRNLVLERGGDTRREGARA
jgi:N-methylhydantoinase A